MTDIELLRKLWSYASTDVELGAVVKHELETSGLPTLELRDEYNRRQGRTDFARLMLAAMRDHSEFANERDVLWEMGNSMNVPSELNKPTFD